MENGAHIRLILWKAEKAMTRLDRAGIAETGLGLSDFTILEALLHKGPLPINAIGGKVLLTSGSMTAAVNRLARRGYVRREQDPGDGRCFHIHLTVAGRRVIEAAFERHAQALERASSALTRDEKSELIRLLKKLGHRADATARVISQEEKP
jgi:MarR family transcriptional regulator, 2-MHQ and catechol-resistance regulon repressor